MWSRPSERNIVASSGSVTELQTQPFAVGSARVTVSG
jgi:hypothetical protein